MTFFISVGFDFLTVHRSPPLRDFLPTFHHNKAPEDLGDFSSVLHCFHCSLLCKKEGKEDEAPREKSEPLVPLTLVRFGFPSSFPVPRSRRVVFMSSTMSSSFNPWLASKPRPSFLPPQRRFASTRSNFSWPEQRLGPRCDAATLSPAARDHTLPLSGSRAVTPRLTLQSKTSEGEGGGAPECRGLMENGSDSQNQRERNVETQLDLYRRILQPGAVKISSGRKQNLVLTHDLFMTLITLF